MSSTPNIQRQLDQIQADQALILSMLRQLLHPATSLSAREKANAVLAAELTGDPKRVKQVLKQINGN